MRGRRAAGAAVVAILLTVTGCTSGGGSAETAVRVLHTYRGTAVVPGASSDGDGRPAAHWIAGREQVALTTYGSSGCPPVPVAVRVVTPERIVLRLKDYGDRFCTFDFAATTSELALPDAVSRRAVVRVTLEAAQGEPAVVRLRPDPTVASRAG